jgi:hypothetical protein
MDLYGTEQQIEDIELVRKIWKEKDICRKMER